MTVLRWRLTLALVGVLLIAGCLPGWPDPDPGPLPERSNSAGQTLDQVMDAGRIQGHMADLQRIADENGGNRATGSPGHDAAVDHTSTVLRELGFTVRLEEFGYAYPQVTAERAEVVSGAEIALEPAVMMGSANTSGEVTARLVVPTAQLGCREGDYASVTGAIVLVARGECEFEVKARHAARAGAVAILVHDTVAGASNFRGSIRNADGTVPAAGIPEPQAKALREALTHNEVRLRIDLQVENRSGTTVNVIADWPRTPPSGQVVMMGAHLDSVADGPGINDNASGVALVLAMAEVLVEQGDPAGLRIGLWGGEEIGLLGSTHHVESLSDTDRSRIEAYLNFDMVASPNGIFGVYGSRHLTQRLSEAFEAAGQDSVKADIGDASDHAPFERAGIPVGGIFTGAGNPMSERQSRDSGGVAGEPYDPCYHRSCDTLDTVTTAHVIERLEIIGDVAILVVDGLLLWLD